MSRKYRIRNEQVLHKGRGRLMTITYELEGRDGSMEEQQAELYDKGNAVAVLLYNRERKTVILTRQFRLATVYKGNRKGMLTEVCAGMIEDLSPDDTIRKEIAEETGYEIQNVVPVMKLFMSPGGFTEMLHFYVAEYRPEDKKSRGGGLEEEGELIKLLEIPFSEAMERVNSGEIDDAKTVILLQYAAIQGLL